MARRTLTDTERAARTARIALLSAAAELVEQNRPADIDKAAAILGKYSRRNIGMILTQAEERGRDIPQAVAGFHDWRKAGRIVRKGSQGYLIYAPVTRGQDDDGTTRVGFTVRYVFDVADTDPLSVDSPATLRESLT